MKRLRRWLSSILTFLSLLLFPTVLVLWYVSYHGNHVAWMRSQGSHDGNRRRIDSFACDRGRLSWSSQNGRLPVISPSLEEDGTLWRSYPRPKYEGQWDYRFESKSRNWPHISQRLLRLRALGFEFQFFGPLPDQPPVYDRSGFHIAAPCSGLALIFGSVVGFRFFQFLRRRRRRANNRCPTCGYDLRASPGRCPECGADELSPSPHRP
jgi:hypothetical protein